MKVGRWALVNTESTKVQGKGYIFIAEAKYIPFLCFKY